MLKERHICLVLMADIITRHMLLYLNSPCNLAESNTRFGWACEGWRAGGARGRTRCQQRAVGRPRHAQHRVGVPMERRHLLVPPDGLRAGCWLASARAASVPAPIPLCTL